MSSFVRFGSWVKGRIDALTTMWEGNEHFRAFVFSSVLMLGVIYLILAIILSAIFGFYVVGWMILSLVLIFTIGFIITIFCLGVHLVIRGFLKSLKEFRNSL